MSASSLLPSASRRSHWNPFSAAVCSMNWSSKASKVRRGILSVVSTKYLNYLRILSGYFLWSLTVSSRFCQHMAWLCGIANINRVTLWWARLVLGWVTVSGFNSRCRTFISICDQPPRSTQPGYPFVGRQNEYQPKCGDALQLGSKGRYGLCVCGM